jgi:hypothetical protein
MQVKRQKMLKNGNMLKRRTGQLAIKEIRSLNKKYILI